MLFPLLLMNLTPNLGSVDLFIGTYTSGTLSKGVYRVQLDTESGALSEPVVAAETPDPSYVAIDPSGKFLYAVNEAKKGAVSAFAIGSDRSLKLLNTQSTQGESPCHLSVGLGSKVLMVANYDTGNLISFPIGADGSLAASNSTFQNSGSGPVADRQKGPHMHWIDSDATGKTVFACDLGTDEILVYKADLGQGSLDLTSPIRVKTAPGMGPRHGVLDAAGKFIYVDDELSNSVTSYAVGDSLTPVQSLPTLPDGQLHHGTTTAEIVLHPSGKWLYVSNRGYDSIAVYEVLPEGKLKLVEIKQLNVRTPRGFAIDPSGKWLVVGGQNSNDLMSLKIDGATGKVGDVGGRAAVPAPVSVLFAR